MKKIFKRNCPNCDKVMEYGAEYLLKRSLNGTGLCRTCFLKSWDRFSGKTHSLEYREIRSNIMKGEANPTKGKPHSPETISKIKQKRVNQIITQDTREKISKAHTGKIVSDETKKKMSETFSGRIFSKEAKKNMSEARKQYFKNMNSDEYDEYCRKMRVSKIEYWKNKHEVYPNYNHKSIPIIENKAKELGITDLQHAENGGEYYIKELGYFLDGYSKEKNIVIEYYEPHHDKQIERDKRREDEIKNLLGCEFIIIR